MADVKRLPWDSDFFGIEIGEWTDGIPTGTDQFELIYRKSATHATADLVGYECTFTEHKIFFAKKLQQTHIGDSNVIDFSAHHSIEQLYRLAYESGKYSRFKLDSRIGTDNFKKLYRLWVDNSVNGQFADKVLVYDAHGTIAGFVSYVVRDDIGYIGLIAVSPDHQGKGIGRKLLHAVEGHLLSRSIYELRIPTQAVNISACEFYRKLGYQIIDNQYISHFLKVNI